MTFAYDTLNRLVSATPTAGPFSNQFGCWSYDSFGNRMREAFSTTPCTNNPPLTSWATYSTSNTNRMDSTNINLNQINYYDAAGDILNDGKNSYLYDGEGRICEVLSPLAGTVTAYIYDADGRRVAKGSATWGSCDPPPTAFRLRPITCWGLRASR